MPSKIALFLAVILLPFTVLAKDRIELNNGDIISGEITGETEKSVFISTQALGPVTIDKAFIKPEKQAALPAWKKDLSLGYSSATGNTRNSRFSGELKARRKTDEDETEVKGTAYYSSSDRQMDSQTWYALGRYGRSFGLDKKAYFFEKLEADHDKFANIHYRLIPSAGLGYWFSDTDQCKALAECGLGLEHTDYSDNSGDSNTLILVPRAFWEKKFWGDSVFSQDLTLYSSLEDSADYRIHSETSLINPINDTLSLKLSLVDDYNADPGQAVKKNDIRFISALTCSF